ncbi:ABC transporter substrate-binding protein [Aureimonas populi]|uniref:ABC transporter substrate-binding protein n=1 Tax=Aureimonas populi TaxID=1701758 RepID=A0ABW5CK69_9HYPH|nr:ABC transporter substrate-binding protein [Aureimonas populi]
MPRTTAHSIAAALAALAVFAPAGPAAAQAVRIGLGVDPAHGAYYLADELGLFEEAGLEVELVRFAQGGEGVDAALTGVVDLTAAADMTTMIRIARAPLVPLAVVHESGISIRLTVGADIKGFEDIETFGIVPGSVSEYAARAALKTFGRDAAGVEFVSVGAPELPALLARGDIDGYFVWEPLASMGVEAGGKSLLTSGEAGYFSHMWLSANPTWYEANGEAAETLLGVVREAARMITEDPQAASVPIAAQTGLPADEVAETLAIYSWTVRDFTPEDVEGYEGIAAFLSENGMTDEPLDIGSVIFPDGN